MINFTLYKREMRKSINILIIFALILTMYISIIIAMYDPKMMSTLDKFSEAMPELMAAVGMNAGATTLIGFMINYLYGFILLVFPMIFCIIRGNGLIAKYVDKGSMMTLLVAPIRRSKVAFTQMFVLLSGIVILVVYATGIEILVTYFIFPKELEIIELLKLNGGLLCLQIFIGSICFLASCIFSETRYSIALGAGIPALMFILRMLSNAGEKAEIAKYFTFFTLFDANGIIKGSGDAILGIQILGASAVVLYLMGIIVFCRKDLHI